MKNFDGIDLLSMLMVIIGGLNWGLVGLFDFNLVTYLLGEMSIFSRIIYILVGLAAFYCIYGLLRDVNPK